MTQRFRKCRLSLVFFLSVQIMLPPALFARQAQIPGFYGNASNLPQIAPNTVPEVKPDGLVQGVAGLSRPQSNQLVVHQNQPKAIIEWESFNIGEEAWTHFDQKGNTDWAALNRIYDQNPSMIFGSLTADGKIYLINQNGTLFGPNSKVNVHTLAASSLNLNNSDFLGDVLKFKGENYQADPNFESPGPIINYGAVQSVSPGAVFLIAPEVENSGSVTAPSGQIGLIAAEEADLSSVDSAGLNNFRLVDPGTATNSASGKLIADSGLAGMYGKVVNQEGLIRSVTAIRKSGRIELRASDLVRTGADSITETPVSTSDEAYAEQAFPFEAGTIEIGGLSRESPLARIEHNGIVQANAGKINFEATDRIYLAQGSRVDASGSWTGLPADALTSEVQLNSDVLKDDYANKYGDLKGESIVVNRVLGSAIGDISGKLSAEELTALERSTEGGFITLNASRRDQFGNVISQGDIIFRQGAVIDISGGGIEYRQGHADTTKILAGQKVYDISDAPQWVQKDGILGTYDDTSKRYGITESFSGLYLGGAVPVKNYYGSFKQGSDAGIVSIIGENIALDGWLNASVFRDPQFANGGIEPLAGTLILGDPADDRSEPAGGTADFVLGEVLIQPAVSALPDTFSSDPGQSPYPYDKTRLSADLINSYGLNNLEIFANRSVVTDKSAIINLAAGFWRDGRSGIDGQPGGRLKISAGSILHQGQVIAPAGLVEMVARQTIGNDSTGYQRVVLTDSSRISVAGQVMDNSSIALPIGESLQSGRPDGGLIRIADGKIAPGDGVFVLPGSVLDTRGGYEIDPNGKIKGGRGGRLELVGTTLLVEGDLLGHSIVGTAGGEISLYAQNLEVVAAQDRISVPATLAPHEIDSFIATNNLTNRFLLADDRLNETGFEHIELNSFYDLSVAANVSLGPSYVKAAPPTAGQSRNVSVPFQNVTVTGEGSSTGNRDFIRIDPLLSAGSSFRLSANAKRGGAAFDVPTARVSIEKGAAIRLGAEGKIALTAPVIETDGLLETLGGEVSLRSRYGDITLKSESRISARGYQRPTEDAPANGLPLQFESVDSGEIALTSSFGDVLMEEGAVLDVRGASRVDNIYPGKGGALTRIRTAGASGNIAISFYEDRSLRGQLLGSAADETIPGGTLSIQKSNPFNGLEISIAEIDRFVHDGFDDISFASPVSIGITGSEGQPASVAVHKRLMFSAPQVRGNGSGSVELFAPWLQLVNTTASYISQSQYNSLINGATPGAMAITLSGHWLDIDGAVSLSGFSEIDLVAQKDITLSERPYKVGIDTFWEGALKAPVNLALTADRIYPTTATRFSIVSKGDIELRGGQTHHEGPICSAGGHLTIEGVNITNATTIAAPMGRILLKADPVSGNVTLSAGSQLTTAGEIPVRFGKLEDLIWTVQDKTLAANAIGTAFSEPAEKSVEVAGHDVRIAGGASIDASGGGTLFTYLFKPDLEGTQDPLKKPGRYIIMPGGEFLIPGFERNGETVGAVQLEGASGVPAGTYALLPEEFAFLPGALVLTDIKEAGGSYLPGQRVSEEGYAIVQGFETYLGTNLKNPIPVGFTVRRASEVLGEGNFTIAESRSGAAGRISIKGDSIDLQGILKMDALPGYSRGDLALSALNIAIVPEIANPLGGFAGLYLPDEYLENLAIDTFRLGSSEITDTSTIKAGAAITASEVILEARSGVELESGSRVVAQAKPGLMDYLMYRYEYETDVGVDTISLQKVESVPSLDNQWHADVSVKTAKGSVPLQIAGSSDKILSVQIRGSRDLSDAVSSLSFIGGKVPESFGAVTLASTTGQINLRNGSALQATDQLNFNGTINLEPGVLLKVENSTISLSGSNIIFAPDGFTGAGENDLMLTRQLWEYFRSIENVRLVSSNDLIFLGDFYLESEGDLIIDAPRIAGLEPGEFQGIIDGFDGRAIANISAQSLFLTNTAAPSNTLQKNINGEYIADLNPDDPALINVGNSTFSLDDTGIISLSASNNLCLDDGVLLVDGFKEVVLEAQNNLVVRGPAYNNAGANGSANSHASALLLDMENKDSVLKINSAQIIAGLNESIDANSGLTRVDPADFRIDAGYALTSISAIGNNNDTSLSPGGKLELISRRIDHKGKIYLPSGTIVLNATGSEPVIAVQPDTFTGDGLFLHDGSIISVGGMRVQSSVLDEEFYSFYRAGKILLDSPEGAIMAAAGSRIDASNPTADELVDISTEDTEDLKRNGLLDAGHLVLLAPQQGVFLEGELRGYSALGQGGTFTLDTDSMPDTSALFALLENAGFNQDICLRVRNGDVVLASQVESQGFKLAADGSLAGGSIDLAGTIRAGNSMRAGKVELFAKSNLTLGPGSLIEVSDDVMGGTGEVYLSSTEGILAMSPTARIQGNSDSSVHFRAPMDGSDVALDLNGVVAGASRVTIEAVQEMQSSWVSTTGEINVPQSDVEWISSNRINLSMDAQTALSLIPGIEIRSAQDLTLASNWDLTSWRNGVTPGILTIRAQGNLSINADLVDHPTGRSTLWSVNAPSWGVNLVAGSDLAAADPKAILPLEKLPVAADGQVKGNLIINSLVYTESAPIHFSSGRNTLLGNERAPRYMINVSMPYTIGSYSGSITGKTGGDLRIGSRSGGGAIQTAVGDIDLVADGNLILDYSRSSSTGVRTTGHNISIRPFSELGTVLKNSYRDAYDEVIAALGVWPDSIDAIRQSDVSDSTKNTVESRYRSSGFENPNIIHYWRYSNGGNISIATGGSVDIINPISAFGDNSWDKLSVSDLGQVWSASYEPAPTGGIVTMADGHLRIETGGYFRARAGAFGKGDVQIYSTGDIDGQFMIAGGRPSIWADNDDHYTGLIQALGNIGLKDSNQPYQKTFETFAAQISVAAVGSVNLNGALNPQARYLLSSFSDNLRYSESAALSVGSAMGDTKITSTNIFPPTLKIEAKGNIILENSFYIAPSRIGNLRLVAGGSIGGLGQRHSIIMSDLAPEMAYAYYPRPRFENEDGEEITYNLDLTTLINQFGHGFFINRRDIPIEQDYLAIFENMVAEGMQLIDQAEMPFFQELAGRLNTPVHAADPEPVKIISATDIKNLELVLPKKAEIIAGRDIIDTSYIGQNLHPSDITLIQADRSMLFSRVPGQTFDFGIQQGGPGGFIVHAGNRIDLGATDGIETTGDLYYPSLGPQGSTLLVVAGYERIFDLESAENFFEELREASVRFSTLKAEGKEEEAQQELTIAREEIIESHLAGKEKGEGTINMVTSQLSTLAEDSDIFILSRGDLNVGETSFFTDESQRSKTGIITAAGGGINIFSIGDINVNESRIMTFRGGDITIWSDRGDINAGRGSKTAISANPPSPDFDENGNLILVFQPPAVGSGIRTLTYDPDGFEGPLEAPLAGDAFITAPEGIIDAGEAGIAARNVILGATKILNTQNISFLVGSVGVPETGPTLNLGAIAGAGSLSETDKIAEESAAMKSAQERMSEYTKALAESLVPKWIAVEVLGFEKTDEPEEKLE